jgi:hypothetical protein
MKILVAIALTLGVFFFVKSRKSNNLKRMATVTIGEVEIERTRLDE